MAPTARVMGIRPDPQPVGQRAVTGPAVGGAGGLAADARASSRWGGGLETRGAAVALGGGAATRTWW